MADRAASGSEVALRDLPGATSPWTPQDQARARLESDKERLNDALTRVRAAAQALTPAARIRQDPMTWVLGAFAVGFVSGWLTAPRRR